MRSAADVAHDNLCQSVTWKTLSSGSDPIKQRHLFPFHNNFLVLVCCVMQTLPWFLERKVMGKRKLVSF